MDNKIIASLTPEEAVRLGLTRPIDEQEIIKEIGKAYLDFADGCNMGPVGYILTMCQIFYNAGRIEGIRAERARRNRHI